MAARANPLFDIVSPLEPEAADAPFDAMARLAALHAEAVETARLANLVGRALHATVALPVMAVLAVLLAGGASLPSTVAWGILMTVATLSIARAYNHASQRPFERAVLQAFAQDLSACLLYAGFAWGAGSFLALASGAPVGIALVYAALPTIVLATLLRERQAALLFLAPVAALTAFACVLRPFAGGTLDAALVLIACAVVAGAIMLVARRGEPQLPHAVTAL